MNDATSNSLIFLGLIYFAPTIVAFFRGHLSLLAIAVLNLVAGWTILGWLVALIWALNSNTAVNRQIATYGKPKGGLGDMAEAFGSAIKRNGRPRH